MTKDSNNIAKWLQIHKSPISWATKTQIQIMYK
jgi:hypothetical protein